MPELPEVETVRRGLQKQLSGARIESVKVLRQASVGYPSIRDFAYMLKGQSFCSFDRRGKYILINLSNDIGMVAHLRMSGRLLVMRSNETEPDHVRIRLNIADGRKLVFDDTRVFGRLWCVPAGKTFDDIVPGLKQLGPEPLGGLDPKHLQSSFAGKKQCIKTALLDQTIIAGIGNIYADESLFRAKINPTRAAGDLSASECC